jgi:UDP-2,4-diacetamido-2,4,6-trideoxy-beta-L-altropyranose hydrolase
MVKKKIFFRADCDSKTGFGHFMRCFALGQMLINEFEIIFAIQEPNNTIKLLLEKEKIEIAILPITNNYVHDAENFICLLNIETIAILDGYNFNEIYQSEIKKYCKKLVYIDDLLAWHQVADVIINHTGSVEISDYNAESYTKFLLGTDYALLRPEFLNKEFENKIPEYFTKYLVNFGGADPINLTFIVCEYLIKRKQTQKLKITAIVGANYKFLKELKILANFGLEILQNLSADDMVAQITLHDVVICSPSTIAYEVANIGKCIFLFQTADNQTKKALFFEKNNLSIYVERNTSNLSALSLLNEFSNNALKIIKNQKAFFDGKSGERLRDFFLKL